MTGTRDDSEGGSEGQIGNVPVFHIDDADLGEFDQFFVEGAPEPDAAHVHRLELGEDEGGGGSLDDMLAKALEGFGGPPVEPTSGLPPLPPLATVLKGPQTRPVAASPRGSLPPRLHVDTRDEDVRRREEENLARREVDLRRQQSVEREAASKVIDDLKAQLKRIQGETTEYRVRLAANAKKARTDGHEDVLKALLPVIDALDGAMASTRNTRDYERLFEGLQLVVRKLQGEMRPLGLEAFESQGQVFDPNRHEALQQVKTGRVESGAVVQVVRRGYLLGDKLLRAALVIVEAPE